MARVAAKAKESVTDKLDKLMQEGDPLLAAAMLMGGTAAASGLTPPLMRLMKGAANADTKDFEDKVKIALSYLGGLGPGLLYTGFKIGGGGSDSSDDPEGLKEYVACFCEGAVEVYLISKLFSNPEFFKLLGSAASQGAGLLKTVAATAI